MEPAFVAMGFLIIFYVLNLIVVGYLFIYHTRMLLVNETTYEMKRRPNIKYFSSRDKEHPFDQGILPNLAQVFKVSAAYPIEWEEPSSNTRGVPLSPS